MLTDKEETRRKLIEFVDNYYFSSISRYRSFSDEHNIGASIRECVRDAIEQDINNALKDFGKQLVHTIVNQLYDNNDFEKDIGLR